MSAVLTPRPFALVARPFTRSLRLPFAPGLHTVTIFVGASLLFASEPMYARLMLPRLGGSPAVWLTALAFFQVVLLAGYLYAHALGQWLGPRRQAAVHLGVVLAAGATLPIGVPGWWSPPADGDALWSALQLLTVGVGAPFFALAATAPLVQSWFARDRGGDPYRLYAASNLGSLVALVAYPLVVEPTIGLGAQTAAWAAGYVLLAVLVAGCGARLWRASTNAVATPMPAARLPLRRFAGWSLLTLLPSAAMVGATSYLTGELAPVPLLWVVPLGLYLSTFVIAFAQRQLLPARAVQLGAVLTSALLLALMMLGSAWPVVPMVVLNLAVLWLVSLACHQSLADSRPPPSRLTAFYLCISFGGALGGVGAAIAAPLLFGSMAELPLTLGVLCLVQLASRDRPRWTRRLAAVGVGLAVAGFVLGSRGGGFAFGIEWRALLHGERSFFGVHRVLGAGGLHLLAHGNTVHGAQAVGEPASRVPLSYYHPSGPVGQAFELLPAMRGSVAVVGLGAGSLACYAQPGQAWTFYEIDPAVVRIARDERYFTYLRDCAPQSRMVLGDGRLTLAASPERYSALVLDAYSTDAPPLHLLTREALDLYLAHLEPGGVIAFHLSNRYLDLRPVVGALAADAGLAAVVRDDLDVSADGKQPSRWALLARDPAALAGLADESGWRALRPAPGFPVWTDDYTSLFSVVRPAG